MRKPNPQPSLRRRLLKGERHLAAICPPMNEWILEFGKCKLEVAWSRSLYEALVIAIAHQQLHAKAAQCILGRLYQAYPKHAFPTAKEIATAKPEHLRSLGFSNAKVLAIQGIAAAATRGEIPEREQATTMSDEALITQLTTLRGVGRWTVEMLLIFTLGRLDVMPVDDYGVRSGLQTLYALPVHPNKTDFAELTDPWRPYRSIGAWYLWRLADRQKTLGKA